MVIITKNIAFVNMSHNEISQQFGELLERVRRAKDYLRLEEKKIELKGLEKMMSKPGFWDNQKEAASISQQAGDLKEEIEKWENLEKNIKELEELSQDTDPDLLEQLREELRKKTKEFERLETEVLLSGKYDSRHALISIHAGAGGVDAQDWAEMLLRMYLRFCEKKGWKTRILDLSPGQEAGIKSVTFLAKGRRAYGYLKSEAGVHRLVRISPFDAEAMRHTSFALVEVLPELPAGQVEIKEDDLRIDVFRSSGHGGQSVNTTDSAVRITHLPTKITVVCRNERSQLQNKETALKILQAKLLALEEEKREQEEKEIRGEIKKAEWGSQIRSYVLHPYKMVKDHRTGWETQEVDKVLDGELDEFIEEYLRFQRKER